MADDEWVSGTGEWGDGLPIGGDSWPAGEWGDGKPLGPAHGTPEPAPPAEWVAEILLGNTVVWSSASISSQKDITIDVSSYTGTHTIKFRLRRTS